VPTETVDPDLMFTVEEIQAITNKPLPAAMALSLAVVATDLVRDWCGWRVAKPATETLTVSGRGSSRVFLPTLHINSVTLVSERDTGELVVGKGFDWDTHGVLDRLGGKWGRKRRSIVAILNHGYQRCPGGVAQAIAAAVARGTLAPAAGVTGETTLGQAIQYSRAASGAAAGSIFLPHELEMLEPFRIPVSR
jgi:hypothetical protein